MAIDFDDLRLLLEIVECGSFSQAAARRRWSQPQVSQRVSALEDHLNVQLFQRHRRGATPTDACHAFLPAAAQALQALESGMRSVHKTPALPKLTLACLPSLAPTVFGALLPALATAPFEVRCTTDHSPIIMDMLLTDKAQLGFVLNCPAVAGIKLERLCVSPIIAVVRRGHPLARHRKLTVADIANAALAPQYWGMECDELLAQVHSHRTVPEPIHTIQPASAALELALEHGFLTFMPEVTVASQLRSGQLVRLNVADLPHWEWELMVAWRSGKRADPPKQLVLKQVRALAAAWSTSTR
jgi:DNA-binding transcriptional LysR family regulator